LYAEWPRSVYRWKNLCRQGIGFRHMKFEPFMGFLKAGTRAKAGQWKENSK
jgi:hypothetical protein